MHFRLRITRAPRIALIFTALTFCFRVHTSQSCAAELNLPVYADSLRNGLKVLIVRDTNVAVVSCRLYYFVGSMYEGPGSSGLSHLFEHMMFKGTQKIGTSDYRREIPYMRLLDTLDSRLQAIRAASPGADTTPEVRVVRDSMAAILKRQREYIRKDELWDLYQTSGATNLNAWTGDDMTAYIVTLPANKVDLFYWLESDRMRAPVLREFASERDVVIEERRMRYDNRPLGKYYERLFALFYTAHPYRIPTIGWMSDIMSYKRTDLENHIQRYYTPDNAIIVLAGNIDSTSAMRSIERYFGNIARARVPKREVITREPPPVGQTRFTMREQAEPRIDILFQIPGYPHDDLYALDILEGVLNGRSGRLYTSLVTERQLCTNTGAGCSFRLHSGYFHVWASMRSSADPDSVERAIRDELAKLTLEPPSARELERVKNTIRMSFVSGIADLESLSDKLAWFERLRSWNDLLTYPERIAAVVPAVIPSTAGRYFDIDLATVGHLLTPVISAGAAPENREVN